MVSQICMVVGGFILVMAGLCKVQDSLQGEQNMDDVSTALGNLNSEGLLE